MPAISIFSANPALRRQAEELIQNLARGHPETFCTDCYDNFNDFLNSVGSDPCRIMFLAHEGPGGAEQAASLREHFPDQRFIWFSDLDFALFSYRMEVDYFGFLPITENKLKTALRNSMHHYCPCNPVQLAADKKPAIAAKPLSILERIAKAIHFSDLF